MDEVRILSAAVYMDPVRNLIVDFEQHQGVHELPVSPEPLVRRFPKDPCFLIGEVRFGVDHSNGTGRFHWSIKWKMKTIISAPWRQEINHWAVAMRASRFTEQTIDLRTSHLRRVARAGLADDPWEVTAQQLVDWTGSHTWSRETARAMRSSLRRFWTWAVEAERATTNPALALPEVRPEQPHPRPAASNLVRSALTASGPRVALMVRLANELGMRRGEVAQVHPANDLIPGVAGWSLLVHGKGMRERILPLPDDLAIEMLRTGDGFLFPSPTGGHLTPHWVGSLVSHALGGRTTMHQLRHLCATEMHAATRDVRLVQVLLGHASLATTQRYLAVDQVQLRAAVTERSARWRSAERAPEDH